MRVVENMFSVAGVEVQVNIFISSERLHELYYKDLGKIPMIKALRELYPGLGLKEAKECVEAWADACNYRFGA